MRYPDVMSEDETLDAALRGTSIARYGDGELRLCAGGVSRSQCRDEKMIEELVDILRFPSDALVCIPNIRPSPRVRNWRPYLDEKYVGLYKLLCYGSAFISRPDSAPWIDRPDYWQKIRSLWTNENVTLVWEDTMTKDLSLTPYMLKGAKSVRDVRGPAVNAYAEIDRIEREIGSPDGTVLLCLGATATILAVRLAARGVHAVDVGHVGTFMPKTVV